MEKIHHHRRDVTNKRGAETPLFFCLLPKFKGKAFTKKTNEFWCILLCNAKVQLCYLTLKFAISASSA
jgi:hypothetical protein